MNYFSKAKYKILFLFVGLILIIQAISTFIQSESFFMIEKYSFVWFFTINNETIDNYPIIKPDNKVLYTWLGYNHTPHNIIEINLGYRSREAETVLLNTYQTYFKKQGYSLKRASTIACRGVHHFSENNLTSYYIITEKNKCITLSLTPYTNNSTLVRLYSIE